MNPENNPMGQPPRNQRIRQESMFGKVVSQYNEYGNDLKGQFSMRELAEKLMGIAEFAEQTLTTENGNDWYDAHTIKRNVKEIRGYVKEFSGIAEEYDNMKRRAEALYDDMGRVLERYFEVNGYDADDDGELDIIPANGEKDPIAQNMKAASNSNAVPPQQTGMYAEDEMVDPDAADKEKDDDLKQRLISVARHRMTGEQLARFDVLPEEKQVRVAWRLVR